MRDPNLLFEKARELGLEVAMARTLRTGSATYHYAIKFPEEEDAAEYERWHSEESRPEDERGNVDEEGTLWKKLKGQPHDPTLMVCIASARVQKGTGLVEPPRPKPPPPPMMSLKVFQPLVAAKLDGPEVTEPFWLWRRIGRWSGEPTFEEYMTRVAGDTNRQFAQRVHDLANPPAPHLLTLKSWQHGFTAAKSRDEAETARQDSLYLAAQAYAADRMSSLQWKAHLACFDHPEKWLELASALEDSGQVVAANAALAAARWLDADGTRDAIAAHVAKRDELPERLVKQPDPEFRSLPLRKRHWRVWDMKNYHHVDLPSLLAFESDESFSIRTRVYRSLGQNPHPAAIQALREATLDPHAFARAQAVRSLGWCLDPTALPLLGRIAENEHDPEVLRATVKARQKIVGYWKYFGEWKERLADPLAMVKTLIDDGLPHLAAYVLGASELEHTPEARPLQASLRDLERTEFRNPGPRSYDYWFEDAAREEEAWRGVDTTPDALARALEEGDLTTQLLTMLAITGKGIEPPPAIERLTAHEGATGWAARRVMRCAGIGTMHQRRAAI